MSTSHDSAVFGIGSMMVDCWLINEKDGVDHYADIIGDKNLVVFLGFVQRFIPQDLILYLAKRKSELRDMLLLSGRFDEDTIEKLLLTVSKEGVQDILDSINIADFPKDYVPLVRLLVKAGASPKVTISNYMNSISELFLDTVGLELPVFVPK